MAVGKGSILRASNTGIRQEPVKEAGEAAYLPCAGAVITVPAQKLKSMEASQGTQIPVPGSLEASISKYGFLEPVLAWNKGEETFLVLDGNKRVQAAKNLGIQMLPVLIAEGLDDAQAWDIYQELHRYCAAAENREDYEVVSSISTDIPVYLL